MEGTEHLGEKPTTGARESRHYQGHIKGCESHDQAPASIPHFPPPQLTSLLGSALILDKLSASSTIHV